MSSTVSAPATAPKRTREEFTGRWAFILAAIGSAVGLGNIWRFPYVAYENGGGAFLLVYLVIVLTLGLPLVVAEIAIGKRSRADGVTAFERLAPASPWRRVGWLGVAGSALILAYYSVIAGWALRYFSAAPERLFGRQIPVAGGLDVGAVDHVLHGDGFIAFFEDQRDQRVLQCLARPFHAAVGAFF